MRFLILSCFWVVLVWPFICLGAATDDFIETLSSGSINWTRSIITAKGVSSPTRIPPQTDPEKHQTQLAQEQAKANLLRALGEIRMDADRYLATVISHQKTITSRLVEMVAAAQVIQRDRLLNGGAEVTVEMSLRGGFSQLILPPEIKQVEPIKAIASTAESINSQSSPLTSSPADGGFTGLIVDARGIGAQPALVPVLIDETGREVYSPAFVSREYAVQNGVCEYAQSTKGLDQLTHIQPNPLIIKGLRAIGRYRCDLVISNADASKLRDTSSNLLFLKQCRVIIVID